MRSLLPASRVWWAAVLAATGLVVASCGSGEDPGTAAPTSPHQSKAPTQAASPAEAADPASGGGAPENGSLPDACSLVSRDEVQQVTGRDPGAPKPGTQGAGAHTYSFCTFAKSPVVWVGPAADYAQAKSAGEKADPVDGVGHEAFWDFRDGTGVYVMAARGDTYFVAINFENQDKSAALAEGTNILSTMLEKLS